MERVLVNGEKQSQVAIDLDIQQQTIARAIKTIYKRHIGQMADVPNEFVIRTVAIHPSLLDKLEEIQRKSYEKLGRNSH